MLVPETGVVVLENGQSKTGHNNFSNKFGKMSMREFEEMKNKYNSGATSNKINNLNEEKHDYNSKLQKKEFKNESILIPNNTTGTNFGGLSTGTKSTFNYDYNKHNQLLKNVYENVVTPLSHHQSYINSNVRSIKNTKINVKGDLNNIHENILYDPNEKISSKKNRDNLDNSLEYLYENFQDDKFVLNENLFKRKGNNTKTFKPNFIDKNFAGNFINDFNSSKPQLNNNKANIYKNIGNNENLKMNSKNKAVPITTRERGIKKKILTQFDIY